MAMIAAARRKAQGQSPMVKSLRLLDILCILALSGLLAPPATADKRRGDAADNWAQWRGPLATGVAPHGDPPLNWNEADGTNIRWKTEIPGRGHSTPIVWNDRVFLTTAIPIGEPLR